MASIIFDFDGTLADTFPLLIDISYRLSPRTKRLSDAKVEALRRLPLLSALLRLHIPWFRIPHLIRLTRRSLTPRMNEVHPYPGVADMLKKLHQAGHDLYILSSNYPENVRVFLRHHKLEGNIRGVDGVFWGNELVKARALKRLIKKYALDPATSYHVGNEALDIRAAKRAGIRDIAVTWSGFDALVLKKARPYAIISQPKEILKLVQ